MSVSLKVLYRVGKDVAYATQTFNDWFDFADFVKQANLKGLDVTICRWEYV